MTDALFRAWRKRLRLTQAQAAIGLGLSKRQVEYFDAGDKEIPRTVRLAMLALEEHPDLTTYNFADGTDVPDDEVIHDPKVEDQYSQESRDRMAALRAKLEQAKDGDEQ